VLSLRDQLVAEQRMDDVRGLDRNLFRTSATGAEPETDEDDDRYSLLSPKERLRCVSEMEKSVDSSAVNADTSSVSGVNTELMLRCVRAMQCKRLTPGGVAAAATLSEVPSEFLYFCYRWGAVASVHSLSVDTKHTPPCCRARCAWYVKQNRCSKVQQLATTIRFRTQATNT